MVQVIAPSCTQQQMCQGTDINILDEEGPELQPPPTQSHLARCCVISTAKLTASGSAMASGCFVINSSSDQEEDLKAKR